MLARRHLVYAAVVDTMLRVAAVGLRQNAVEHVCYFDT